QPTRAGVARANVGVWCCGAGPSSAYVGRGPATRVPRLRGRRPRSVLLTAGCQACGATFPIAGVELLGVQGDEDAAHDACESGKAGKEERFHVLHTTAVPCVGNPPPG